ncbi:hypothetical protein Gogos_020715 [Gossypium gossypioides]|uniref:DUF7745 domain-containing protein n=1 Tax=Gossypium gossypioides TaxID=34282 RepID=A0A7J9D5I4_GOSGO|nr:hypothetical protein [Gossypium gossypioides]
MECRMNHKDDLKGIWQSWGNAKKTHFQDKYGNVAQLLFVKSDDALLKAMVHFWDPTYRCFTFNEVDMKQNVDFRGPLANLMGLPVDAVKARLKYKNSPCIYWSDIRDAMGKACGDRHLALFTFSVYRLIVFPKTLGYVSVELADFLFQIEKGVNPALAVLVKTIISLNFIRSKGDGHFLGCTQLLFVWMKSHFGCLYKLFRQYIDILRNRMEGSRDDSKNGTHWVRWSFMGSFNWHIGSHQLFLVDGVDGSEPIQDLDDTIVAREPTKAVEEPLEFPTGPITIARAKRFKEGVSALIDGIWCNTVAGQLENIEPTKPCNLFHAQLAQI